MSHAEFGIHSSLTLPDQIAADRIGNPEGEPLDDPIAATRAALADPLDFPPLQQCVVPGDKVVLVLSEGLPNCDQMVAGAVAELIEAGVGAASITVLRHHVDARLTRKSPTRRLPAEYQNAIRVDVHDPTDRNQLAMLNVSSSAKPIYLNRAMVEADLVLPMGTARVCDSLGYLGCESTVFPGFSDRETQARFLKPRSVKSRKLRERRLSEVREVMWFLGARLIVEAVPAPGGKLMHIVAGELDAVAARSRQLCDAIWRCEVPHRASIVVATLPGGREQQSWSNIGRALDSALRVVQDDGTIAICCDLRSKPGRSLRRLSKAHSLELAQRTIDRDATSDALPASQLAQALQRVNVYLLSRLDEECVQSLGLAYVATPDEVSRLVERHDSCILLQNAHQTMPTVAAEISS